MITRWRWTLAALLAELAVRAVPDDADAAALAHAIALWARARLARRGLTDHCEGA